MSFSKTIIMGRLGKDVSLAYTPSGTAVAKFSVATSETFMKDGQKQEITDWHNVVVFGKLAELCSQYLSKGRLCLVEGKNKTRTWEDKDKKKNYMTEINASSVQFIGDSKQNQQSGDEYHDQRPQGTQEREYTPEVNPEYTSDSIPF